MAPRYQGSDLQGGPAGSTDGPCLCDVLPDNPVTGDASVRVVEALSVVPAAEGGWIDCPSTGELRAELLGECLCGELLHEH